MKKQSLFWILLIVWLVGASRVLAQDVQDGLAGKLRERHPDAVIQYAIEERDDGKMEWNVFFTTGTQFGMCEMDSRTLMLRDVKTYDLPAGALTADKAIEALVAQKGELTLLSLELEYDDGRLLYQGEADWKGQRFEFEMTVDGRLVEWERD